MMITPKPDLAALRASLRGVAWVPGDPQFVLLVKASISRSLILLMSSWGQRQLLMLSQRSAMPKGSA